MCALVALLGFTACDKNDESSLDLGGSCLVEKISLNGMEGIVDLSTRTIEVRVPKNYSGANAMEVSDLVLSNGAKSDIVKGQVLDMEASHTIHVTNGDLYLDWTLSILPDEAKILSFIIDDNYPGVIDEDNKKITVYVPKSAVDVKNATPSIKVSKYATVDPADGISVNFTDPRTYTVTNNTATAEYLVSVIAIDKPKALFVGDAAAISELNPEANAACLWMLANVPETMYASFDDIKAETIDMSECKIVWWHYDIDANVDGHDGFTSAAKKALAVKTHLRDYYLNGGALLLTRYAVMLPSFIGATGDDEWTTPNNCWASKKEAEAEVQGGPWDFIKEDSSHPIYANTIPGSDANRIYLTDAGYATTNSVAQYHIGSDWGGYDNDDAWKNRTGAKILGKGGDGAIVAWEYPAKDGKGGIICIGSGAYDWYSVAPYTENFHNNVGTITKNAIDYLTK